MRPVQACLAVLLLAAACSKPAAAPPAPAPVPTPTAPGAAAPAAPAAAATPAAPTSGPAISGTYTAGGKPAALAFATSKADTPFDGKPVTILIFSTQDQAGSERPDFDALFGKFGNALIVRVQPDGRIIGAELMHEGLKGADQSVSWGGVLETKNFSAAGGQLSGTITSNGPHDVFGSQVDVNLTFHVKAP